MISLILNTAALDAARVDQSSKLRNLEKVFYPPTIRVKVVAPTQSCDTPPTQSTHAKGPNPTPGDKAPTASLTSAKKEAPVSDETHVLALQTSVNG